ncbi:hypothetical protein LSAT2_005921 [Lamellibrachia satsuma]|nr:hypothetical protein LSAT2_005921 [Lamellibrachia satsuma]
MEVSARLHDTWTPRRETAGCRVDTCRLPSCVCAGKTAPGGLERDRLPQIVTFTFDDAVNKEVFGFYEKLFPPNRTNPNGCPASATFFVSHQWTDYSLVKRLYLAGHEIASHSISHRMPQTWWRNSSYSDLKRELNGQRHQLTRAAAVPPGEVRGLRMPFLEVAGNKQFQV